MSRKDLWMRQSGPLWTVGARHGDAESRIWRRSFDRDSVARALIDNMMKRVGGRDAWLDLTNLALNLPKRASC
jgi:hypothetical protein